MKTLYALISCFLILRLASAQIDQPPPPPPQPAPTEDIPFKVVEDMPRFPGCEDVPKAERKQCADEKLLAYIYRNLVYPEEAKFMELEGTGVVSFIIEKDGSISSAKVVRSLGYGTDEEMIRLINKMNEDGIRWILGSTRGRPVRVLFNLPIKFSLDKND